MLENHQKCCIVIPLKYEEGSFQIYAFSFLFRAEKFLLISPRLFSYHKSEHLERIQKNFQCDKKNLGCVFTKTFERDFQTPCSLNFQSFQHLASCPNLLCCQCPLSPRKVLVVLPSKSEGPSSHLASRGGAHSSIWSSL